MGVRRLVSSWNRRDWAEVSGIFAVVAVLHVVGFGLLILLVAPVRYQVGTQVFSIGLGISAYMLGLRHAFDADHIAAIGRSRLDSSSHSGTPRLWWCWHCW